MARELDRACTAARPAPRRAGARGDASRRARGRGGVRSLRSGARGRRHRGGAADDRDREVDARPVGRPTRLREPLDLLVARYREARRAPIPAARRPHQSRVVGLPSLRRGQTQPHGELGRDTVPGGVPHRRGEVRGRVREVAADVVHRRAYAHDPVDAVRADHPRTARAARDRDHRQPPVHARRRRGAAARGHAFVERGGRLRAPEVVRAVRGLARQQRKREARGRVEEQPRHVVRRTARRLRAVRRPGPDREGHSRAVRRPPGDATDRAGRHAGA